MSIEHPNWDEPHCLSVLQRGEFKSVAKNVGALCGILFSYLLHLTLIILTSWVNIILCFRLGYCNYLISSKCLSTETCNIKKYCKSNYDIEMLGKVWAGSEGTGLIGGIMRS
jgi:hypothetical protein